MIGIIGGSGFYKFLPDPKEKEIETPFGSVTVEIGTIAGKDVCFIPRHGKGHSITPQKINYRANIFAAHLLGVKKIYATNAFGSLQAHIQPGTFVIPHNILDFTYGRGSTFFDGDPDFDGIDWDLFVELSIQHKVILLVSKAISKAPTLSFSPFL